MTAPAWTPSPPLANAVKAALTGMARQWPRAMGLARESTDEAQAFLGDYAAAMRGVDLRAIPIAAREWVATESMPPRPAEFGQLAREMTRQHFPPLFDPATDVRQLGELQSTTHLKNASAIETRSRRAYEALGSWGLVSHVWGVLYQAVADAHPDLAEACRRGEIPWDSVDDAIAQVRSGRRAKGGPLNPAAA